MSLNPFFLQGSAGEQRLVQSLINEQLRMYGLDVIYIPRKFINKKTIIQEVQSSRFDDNFAIEAYVNTYDGYGGSGDILTKFGVSLRDEVTLTISKERFEDFISPFLNGMDTDEIELSTRPREGDLIYFPLGQRLFEVKFVEHEQPFYQLGKLYVYELKCELFEYEDEVLDTGIDEVDRELEEIGFITTLNLVSFGSTATAVSAIQGSVSSGYIKQIFLNNDGYGYISNPVVSISTSPTGVLGDNASAVAITTVRGGVRSVETIYLTNAGAGYTVPPIITISGGGGAGAAATCSIETTYKGVVRFIVNEGGVGYGTAPIVTIESPSVGAAATVTSLTSIGAISGISITNTGTGYTAIPTVTFASPPIRTGVVSTSSIYTSGSGYSVGTYSLMPYAGVVGSGGTTAVINVSSVNGSGGITGITTTYGGYGYSPNEIYYLLGGSNNARIQILSTTTGTGITATATATISGGQIQSISLGSVGSGYTSFPVITIDNSDNIKDTNLRRATGISSIGLVGSNSVVRSIYITDPGFGYVVAPTVTIANPETITGIGTYLFNEIIIGQRSKIRARVKSWDSDTGELKISFVGTASTQKSFYPGETIVGQESGATYSVKAYNQDDVYDKYSQNDEIETEADLILDFSESNPFGIY